MSKLLILSEYALKSPDFFHTPGYYTTPRATITGPHPSISGMIITSYSEPQRVTRALPHRQNISASGRGISLSGSPAIPAALYNASFMLHARSRRPSPLPHCKCCDGERKRGATRLSWWPREIMSASIPIAAAYGVTARATRPRQWVTDILHSPATPSSCGAPDGRCLITGSDPGNASASSRPTLCRCMARSLWRPGEIPDVSATAAYTFILSSL